MFSKPELTRLCAVDDIPEGSLRSFTVDGLEILVIRIANTFHAISERCTHRGGPLSEGTLDKDGVVTCPWHFGQFDIKTGQAVGPPPSDPLQRYQVNVENGILYLSKTKPILA